MIDERGADYVPNDSVNSLSCCTNPLGDTSDQIQRDTVFEEIECRLGRVRCSSLSRVRRVSVRTLDFIIECRTVSTDYPRRIRTDDKINFQIGGELWTTL